MFSFIILVTLPKSLKHLQLQSSNISLLSIHLSVCLSVLLSILSNSHKQLVRNKQHTNSRSVFRKTKEKKSYQFWQGHFQPFSHPLTLLPSPGHLATLGNQCSKLCYSGFCVQPTYSTLAQTLPSQGTKSHLSQVEPQRFIS